MNPTAYKELVSRHNTLSHVTDLGRISARKERGEYIVTIEQFGSCPRALKPFKTFRGCIIAFEGAKRLI